MSNFANGKIRSRYDLELLSCREQDPSCNFHLCGKRLETISARFLNGKFFRFWKRGRGRRKEASSSAMSRVSPGDRFARQNAEAFYQKGCRSFATCHRSRSLVRLSVCSSVPPIASPRGLYNFSSVISFTRNYLKRQSITSLEEKYYLHSKKKLNQSNSNRIDQTQFQSCIWRTNSPDFVSCAIYFRFLIRVKQAENSLAWDDRKMNFDESARYQSHLSSDLLNPVYFDKRRLRSYKYREILRRAGSNAFLSHAWAWERSPRAYVIKISSRQN